VCAYSSTAIALLDVARGRGLWRVSELISAKPHAYKVANRGDAGRELERGPQPRPKIIRLEELGCRRALTRILE